MSSDRECLLLLLSSCYVHRRVKSTCTSGQPPTRCMSHSSTKILAHEPFGPLIWHRIDLAPELVASESLYLILDDWTHSSDILWGLMQLFQ